MKKQENKNRRNFLLCMGGLLVLIVFAFAGPEGLLRLQDKSRLTGSVSISNTGTDYTVWKEEYETDTVRRLQNLADGIALGKQYYISEQDYEAATDGEIYSLIDEYILNTEWNYTFQDMGVIPEDYFFKNMDTDHISIKRYILYDEKLSDGVAIMAYDICMRMKEEEVTGVSIECVVDSETGTLYAMKVMLEDETEPVTWDDIGADAPYYFITDYMQSYLHDYDSGTYIEIEGEVPYDTNAQIMWDKEAEIEAEAEAKERTAMENDGGEYTSELEYGEHKLHLIATLLNAAELITRGAGQGDAKKYLNLVHKRAGLVTEIEPTLDNIIEERHLEFVGEGKRYWDLIRTGKAASVLVPDAYGYRTNSWSSSKKYLPIPQKEIDAAKGTLVQNNY